MSKSNDKIFILKNEDEYSYHIPSLNFISDSSNSLDTLFTDDSLLNNHKSNLLHFQSLPKAFNFFTYFLYRFLAALCVLIILNIFINQVIEHRYHRFEKKLIEMLNPTQEKQDERLDRFQNKLKTYTPFIKEVLND